MTMRYYTLEPTLCWHSSPNVFDQSATKLTLSLFPRSPPSYLFDLVSPLIPLQNVYFVCHINMKVSHVSSYSFMSQTVSENRARTIRLSSTFYTCRAADAEQAERSGVFYARLATHTPASARSLFEWRDTAHVRNPRLSATDASFAGVPASWRRTPARDVHWVI